MAQICIAAKKVLLFKKSVVVNYYKKLYFHKPGLIKW